MMDAFKVGQNLVEYCKAGKEHECLEKLYADHATSFEPMAGPNQVCEGISAIKEKHEWWKENTTVHAVSVTGPFPFKNRFSVIFDMDVTMKHDQKRVQMQEVGLYTVENGKIVKEEFMYQSEK